MQKGDQRNVIFFILSYILCYLTRLKHYFPAGITNFVTPVAAAYWAHSPVVCITPEAGKVALGYILK